MQASCPSCCHHLHRLLHAQDAVLTGPALVLLMLGALTLGRALGAGSVLPRVSPQVGDVEPRRLRPQLWYKGPQVFLMPWG